MQEALRSFVAFLQFAFFGGFLCILPLLAIGSIIWSAVIKLTQQRKAHQKIAQELGYAPLNQNKHFMRVWYGGLHRGRRVALRTFSSTYRYYYDGRSRTGVKFHLRLAMQVNIPQTLETSAYRAEKKRGIPSNFEEAFEVQNPELLPESARQAMLAFIYKGYPTKLKKDLSWRFTRGARNLLFRDRAGLSEFPQGVLPDARMLLIHDHPDPGISLERLRALLDDMAAVAQSIETGILPRRLAGQSTPPPEGVGKFIPWVIGLLVMFGIPALAIICAQLSGWIGT